MLLAVSLYAHLKNVDTDTLNDETIRAVAHDINTLFRLVKSNEKALLIPILMHNSIWKKVELPNEDELRLFPIRDSCRKILKSVPPWLRYDEKVMSDDVALIVRKYVGRKIVQ